MLKCVDILKANHSCLETGSVTDEKNQTAPGFRICYVQILVSLVQIWISDFNKLHTPSFERNVNTYFEWWNKEVGDQFTLYKFVSVANLFQ